MWPAPVCDGGGGSGGKWRECGEMMRGEGRAQETPGSGQELGGGVNSASPIQKSGASLEPWEGAPSGWAGRGGPG